jgi:hypothetical protein
MNLSFLSDRVRYLPASFGFLGVLVVAGCQFWSPFHGQREVFPTVLPPSPTLQQVMSAVNSNSSQISNFQTEHAVISSPDFPTLRATVVFERPLRLRIRGGTGVTGLELDLGSNDELFWVWIRRDPQMYFCRHSDFASSPIAREFPLEPRWLIEALGIVELDPHGAHQGPEAVAPNRLRVVSWRESPQGGTTRLLTMDARTAVVLEQEVYDATGRLIVAAKAHRHRRDPLTGLIMAQVVSIQCPQFGLSLQIDLGNLRINRPLEVTPDIWQMPQYEGWAPVDLARIAFAPLTPRSSTNTLDPASFGAPGQEIPRLARPPRTRVPFR